MMWRIRDRKSKNNGTFLVIRVSLAHKLLIYKDKGNLIAWYLPPVFLFSSFFLACDRNALKFRSLCSLVLKAQLILLRLLVCDAAMIFHSILSPPDKMNALTPSCRMPHCMWLHVMCACRRRESYKLKKIGFALIRRVHVSHSDATHSFGSFGHTFRCERHCTGNVISLMWQRMTANSAVILLLHAVAFQMLFYLSPTDTFHFVAFSLFLSTLVTVNSLLYLSLICTPIDETLLDTCWC